MTKILQWRFFSPRAKKGKGIGVPMLDFTEAELNILWYLCKNGPRNAYELDKAGYYLPEDILASERVWGPERHDLEQRIKKKIRYHRPFIVKILRRLQKKGLVEIVEDSQRDRIRKIAEPSFSGLIVYLQNSTDKQSFCIVCKHFPKSIPFSEKWNWLTEKIGKQKCMKALEQTLKEFTDIQTVCFTIRQLKMQFEGFLEGPRMLINSPKDGEMVREKDLDVQRNLGDNEAVILRNSYIASLAMNDIEKLSGKNMDEVESLVQTLDSEKELACFEKRQAGVNSLFEGNRLKEYLPKYAKIEYFFTGKFVENLLWHEKKILVKPDNEIHDFEVEYLT